VAIPKSHGSALDQAGLTLPAGECDLERLGSQLLADLETRPLLQVGTEPVVVPLEDKTYRNRLPSRRDDASSSASLGSLCMGSARMKPERKPIQTQGRGSLGFRAGLVDIVSGRTPHFLHAGGSRSRRCVKRCHATVPAESPRNAGDAADLSRRGPTQFRSDSGSGAPERARSGPRRGLERIRLRWPGSGRLFRARDEYIHAPPGARRLREGHRNSDQARDLPIHEWSILRTVHDLQRLEHARTPPQRPVLGSQALKSRERSLAAHPTWKPSPTVNQGCLSLTSRGANPRSAT
jgi:hypothetical protein